MVALVLGWLRGAKGELDLVRLELVGDARARALSEERVADVDGGVVGSGPRGSGDDDVDEAGGEGEREVPRGAVEGEGPEEGGVVDGQGREASLRSERVVEASRLGRKR